MIPDEIRSGWDARERGADARSASGSERFDAYRAAFPELAAEFERRMSGELPGAWRDVVRNYVAQAAQATRERSRRARHRSRR